MVSRRVFIWDLARAAIVRSRHVLSLAMTDAKGIDALPFSLSTLWIDSPVAQHSLAQYSFQSNKSTAAQTVAIPYSIMPPLSSIIHHALLLLLFLSCSITRRTTTMAFTAGFPTPRLLSSTSTILNASPQDYLEKAEQIRAEIAALEGKTLSQVQDEAKEKKDREQQQREELQKSPIPTERNIRQFGRALEIPSTRDEMVIQAARAVERAVNDGILRQTVRLALLETSEQTIYDSANNMWPGGAVQMSREAAKPLGTDLMKNLRFDAKDSYRTCHVQETDVWDFDGSALLSMESDENRTTTALVFANTDVKYTNDIRTLDETAKPNDLILLINPFWRNIDSWGINLLAPGAKTKAQQVIFDGGFDTETYVCMRFRCRGEECIAIKAYPYDWQIYAYLEDSYSPIRLGESETEPKSDVVTELLNARPEFKLSKTMRQMQR